MLEQSDRILFIGDSITDSGRAQPIGEGGNGGLGSGWVALADALVCAIRPGLHLRVFNMGTSGNTVRDLAERWDRDVVDLRPSWVTVMIGVNDVWRQFDSPTMPEAGVPLEEYRETLESLVERTRPAVRGLTLMTPFFLEPNRKDPMRACLDGYGMAVREIADRHQCSFVDTQEAMDRLLEHRYSASIGWDRVHVNATGNMVIALEWLKSMGMRCNWAG